MFNLVRAQEFLSTSHLDGWLVYDYEGTNHVLSRILSRSLKNFGKTILWIPANGTPSLLTNELEEAHFQDLPYSVETYGNRDEWVKWLKKRVGKCQKIAMEYSEFGMLPSLSQVDAGTIELIRSLGPTVVSSADVFGASCTAWGKVALSTHIEACHLIDTIREETFAFISSNLGKTDELTVQYYIESRYQHYGLETEGQPIVAVNANSRFPHYNPTLAQNAPIKKGDWILLDIWARKPSDENVFADITWVAYAGTKAPEKYKKIFKIVKTARDLVVEKAKAAWNSKTELQGWELDVVARDYITEQGYGEYFIHTTGHSMGPGHSVHALGTNLASVGTKDTRLILSDTGFSVEPGIYLPDFGVRLEIDVYMDPQVGPLVTTKSQEDIVLLG